MVKYGCKPRKPPLVPDGNIKLQKHFRIKEVFKREEGETRYRLIGSLFIIWNVEPKKVMKDGKETESGGECEIIAWNRQKTRDPTTESFKVRYFTGPRSREETGLKVLTPNAAAKWTVTDCVFNGHSYLIVGGKDCAEEDGYAVVHYKGDGKGTYTRADCFYDKGKVADLFDKSVESSDLT